MNKIFSILLLLSSYVYGEFLVSAGGYDVSEHKHYYSFKCETVKPINVNITKVLHEKSKNTNSVTMWINKDWQEDWYDVETTQHEVIDRGYTPIYMFYWFGDDINVAYVKENEKAYFKQLKKFLKYLKKLKGQKIVVLNPEYNMEGVGKWDGMNDIFLKSYKILREDKQVLLGPCVGDFGDYTALNEIEEWKLFDKSLKKAAKKADFIAFQEMRGLTRNSKCDMRKTAKRAYHFSKYLHKKYNKPTLLAYVALSSYGKGGEEVQAEAFKSFIKYLPKMKKEAGLLSFGLFHYFDYPGHVGYFNKAEEYFGVLRKDGTKKPAFKYYNQLH